MTAEELVMHELRIPLSRFSEGLRPAVVAACEASMGELLQAVEHVEQVDPKKGAVLRQLWQQRHDVATLRKMAESIECLRR